MRPQMTQVRVAILAARLSTRAIETQSTRAAARARAGHQNAFEEDKAKPSTFVYDLK